MSNLINIFKIRRNSNTCISCKLCDKVCPTNILVSQREIIRNHQYIRCYNCTPEAICPGKDTVFVSTFNLKRK